MQKCGNSGKEMVNLGFINAWGLWLSAYIRIWFSVDQLVRLVVTHIIFRLVYQL